MRGEGGQGERREGFAVHWDVSGARRLLELLLHNGPSGSYLHIAKLLSRAGAHTQPSAGGQADFLP